MIKHTIQKLSSLFVLALFVAGVVALSPMRAAAQDDPPGRVARLNYIQGSVAYQVSGDQDWVQADPNRPLTAGDNLWVDKNSRGEVHIGSTAIRMSSETGISFLTLDDNTVQLQLAQGAIEVHVRDVSSDNALEIDTPNLAFTIDSGGEYRIETDPNGGSSIVTVRQGQGEVTGGGDSWNLRDGQQYTFNGTDQLSYDASQAPGYNDFENWCQSRNQRENASQSAKYVSRDTDGYYDLDEYGDWHTDPDYGAVWVPRGVEAGWAPYHTGHWVFVAPWGWTWVDAEPWGFAPFHYGRWARWHDSWCWVPGPRQVRPVYSPAMVGWVGGGAGGLAVGWFPLGPREVFVPGYRVSDRYVRAVNLTNTRTINQTYIASVYQSRGANVRYVNSSVSGAVTTVPRNVFTSAQPVNGRRMNTPEGEAGRFATTGVPPTIAPVRQSVLGGTRVAALRPPQVFMNRTVVARTAPAAESSARVRLVAPVRQAGRGTGFNGAPGFNRPAVGGQQPGQAGAGFNRPGAGGQQPVQAGAGFNRPQAGVQQAGQAGSVQPRQLAPAAPSMQRRPEVPQQSAAETDTRSWAERAHALEQHALPPTQGPRNDRPYEPREFSDGTSDPGRYQPNTITRESDGQTFRPAQQPRAQESDSASFGGEAGQSGRVEQVRPPVNNYNRPPMDDRRSTPAPEQRFNAPAPPEAPVPHFNVPGPPPAPVPHFNTPAPPPAPVPTQTAPRAAPAPQQHPQPSNRGEDRPSPRVIGRSDSPH